MVYQNISLNGVWKHFFIYCQKVVKASFKMPSVKHRRNIVERKDYKAMEEREKKKEVWTFENAFFLFFQGKNQKPLQLPTLILCITSDKKVRLGKNRFTFLGLKI